MTMLRESVQKFRRALAGRDKGSVAVQFVLVIPLLMAIVGVLVQYALMVNAYFTVQRSLAAAARSAMTSLPTDQVIGDEGGPDNPPRAARMTLESLSPKSVDAPSDEAQAIANALAASGLTLPDDSYAARYTFAQEATVVTIVPLDGNGNVINAANYNYAQQAAPRARITVTYQFRLTAPLVAELVGTKETIAGVEGWYTTLSAQMDVQLSPGREAGQ